jgi:predicted RNase H-like HicB family nuclease
MKQYKIVVEKHPDGYVAYPLGIKGVVVGQGDTYEEALSDVKSAIRFHSYSYTSGRACRLTKAGSLISFSILSRSAALYCKSLFK